MGNIQAKSFYVFVYLSVVASHTRQIPNFSEHICNCCACFSNQALLALLKDNPYTTVAKSLGVSDNAIRKHLLKHPE